MTLNGVIALILAYFTEFDSFSGLLRHSGWRQTCLVVCRISPSTFGQNWPTLQRGLSAIAELLVSNTTNTMQGCCESNILPMWKNQLIVNTNLCRTIDCQPLVANTE